jgi:hypothetical protein
LVNNINRAFIDFEEEVFKLNKKSYKFSIFNEKTCNFLFTLQKNKINLAFIKEITNIIKMVKSYIFFNDNEKNKNYKGF